MALGILFLTLSGANIDFLDRELWWRTYNTKKTVLTIKRIKFVEKKEFAAAILDPKHETYVVDVVFFSATSFTSTPLDVYTSCRPQIVGLIAEEASIKVFAKYLDFVNVFSPDLASKLLKHTGINNHAIKLINGQ